MILKITMDTKRLAALHEALQGRWNEYTFPADSVHGDSSRTYNFVHIKRSESAGEAVKPFYNVTLEIAETYSDTLDAHEKSLVPLSVMVNVFEAISLYPDDRG